MYEYEYKTLEELSHRAVQHDIRIAEVVIRHEMETSEQTETAVRQCMASRLEVFRESIEAGLSDTGTSVSGLVGGDADKLAHSSGRLLGSLARTAEMYALAVSEANAKMFKIVACPTAGSCGIVPAVLTAVSEELGTSPQENVEALLRLPESVRSWPAMPQLPGPSADARLNAGRLLPWLLLPRPSWQAALMMPSCRPWHYA